MITHTPCNDEKDSHPLVTTKESSKEFQEGIPTSFTASTQSLSTPSSASSSSTSHSLSYSTCTPFTPCIIADEFRYIRAESSSSGDDTQQVHVVYEVEDLEGRERLVHFDHTQIRRNLLDSYSMEDWKKATSLRSTVPGTTQEYRHESRHWFMDYQQHGNHHGSPTNIHLQTNIISILLSENKSSTQSSRRKHSDSNVHEKSIITRGKGLFIAKELEENEKFANDVGIHYSSERGDYFTIQHFQETEEQKDDPFAIFGVSSPTYSSPQHGKSDNDSLFRRMYGQVELSNMHYHSSLTLQDSFVDVHVNKPSHSPMGMGHHLLTPQTKKSMIANDKDIMLLRKRASDLNVDWTNPHYMTPCLARTLRDFEFAREKRKKCKAYRESKWGVLGLYDFLTDVRTDIEWAEDAGMRRAMGASYQPWSEFANSKKRGYNQPFFTYFLLISTSIFLLCSFALNRWAIESFRTNPMIGPSVDTLVKMGAKDSDLIVNKSEWWRLLATMFLHGGIIHFVINCFAIYFVCRPVEYDHGSFIATTIFIFAAIGSNVVSAVFMPEFITVGASGGIFGLIGCCLADILLNRKILFSDFVNKDKSRIHHILVILTIFFDMAINIVIGLTPMIDNFTHLGGLMFGFLFGMCALDQMSFHHTKKYENNYRSKKRFLSKMVGLVITVAIFTLFLVLLFTGDGKTSPCPQCKKLSCVPFPPWTDKKWYYCDNCELAGAKGTLNSEGNINLAEIQCPNNKEKLFIIDDDIKADVAWLQSHLIDICRQVCFH